MENEEDSVFQSGDSMLRGQFRSAIVASSVVRVEYVLFA